MLDSKNIQRTYIFFHFVAVRWACFFGKGNQVTDFGENIASLLQWFY